MRIRVIASLIVALATTVAAGQASASFIGVFFDSLATDCDGSFPRYIDVDIHVYAVLGGDAAAGGTTQAEFRITGLPGTGHIKVWTVNPVAEATSVGNPISAQGGNVAFPSCQGGPLVWLGKVTVTRTGSTATTGIIRVDRKDPPSNPDFSCPLLVLCDAPVYTKLCVVGSEAFYDGRTCTVSVEEKSWSGVKSLFH